MSSSSFEVPTVHVIQDSREFVERFAEDVVLAREWFAAEEKGGGDWEFVTRTSEGVDVWRQAVPDAPGLYMWLTHGPIQVDAAVFAKVYNDLDYRRQWDDYALDLRKVSDLRDGEEDLDLKSELPKEVIPSDDTSYDGGILYWSAKYPWPMWNRDYVFYRGVESDPETGITVAINRGGATDEVPEDAGNQVRVDTYFSLLVAQPWDPKKQDDLVDRVGADAAGQGKWTDAFMMTFDDPKGNIPSSLVSYGVKKGLSSFQAKLTAACNSYPNA